MSKVLAIDTTNSNLTVVVINEDKTFSTTIEVGKSGHSSILIPTIQNVLSDAKLSVNEIDTVGIVVGPGSFTGIRIGVSAMTAIAFANNCKRISINSFELISLDRKKCVCAVDAGHDNLYVAYCNDGKIESTVFVESNDDFNRKDLVFDSLYDNKDALIKVLKSKIEKDEYVSVFDPYYMRKSQAEREKDEIWAS